MSNARQGNVKPLERSSAGDRRRLADSVFFKLLVRSGCVSVCGLRHFVSVHATPWKGWKNFLSLAPARTSAEDAIKSSVRPVRERSSSDDLVKSTGTVLQSAVLASSETLPQLQRVPHRNSPRIVPYCDSDSQCVTLCMTLCVKWRRQCLQDFLFRIQ